MNQGGGYRGSTAVWMGDRIAPRALAIRNGAEYPGGFYASRLVRVWPGGDCLP